MKRKQVEIPVKLIHCVDLLCCTWGTAKEEGMRTDSSKVESVLP